MKHLLHLLCAVVTIQVTAQRVPPSAYELAVLADLVCAQSVPTSDEIGAAMRYNQGPMQQANAGGVAVGGVLPMAPGAPVNANPAAGPQPFTSSQAATIAAIQSEWNALVALCNWKKGDPEKLVDLGEAVRNMQHYTLIQSIVDHRGADPTGLGIGAVLGLNQSELIRGITKWAIRRAEEELMQAFLHQWLDSLKAQRELALMMSTTLNTMNSTSLSTLLTDGEVWRSAFQKDLDRSPERLDSLLILVLQDLATKAVPAEKNKRLRTYDELASAGQVLGDVYRALKQQKDLETELALHAHSLLGTQPRLPVSGTAGEYAIAHRAIIIADLLLQSTVYRSTGGQRKHLDPLTIIRMDEVRFERYWKFVCGLHAKSLMNGLTINEAKLDDIATDQTLIKGKQALLDGIDVAHGLQQVAVTVAAAPEKKLDATQTLEVLDQILALLEKASAVATSFTRVRNGVDETRWPFFKDVARPVLEEIKGIHAAVLDREYGDIVTSLVDIGTFLAHVDKDGKPQPTVQNENLQRWVDAINKYGGFMADIIEAENSDEVEAALERVTAGVGSYRVKMASAFSVDVTLFPGIYGGLERVSMDPSKVGASPASASFLGGYLPIGFSFTVGTGGKWIPTVGLYAQVVDLGTALSYEINPPDSVAATPAYSWDMMLSPGGYLTLQLGRSPVTLGLGGSVAPRLREVDAQGLQFRADAARFGAFLGVDITALHLYSSRKKFNSAWSTYRNQ